MAKKRTKIELYAIVITSLFVLVSTVFVFIFIREKYPQRIAVKLGLVDYCDYQEMNYTVIGWNNTLEKLDYDADIVFLGDSITAQSDFRKYFSDKKIVTLGCPGDNISGMIKRVTGVAAVNPEQIYIMGGINGLKAYNVQEEIEEYNELLSLLKEKMPHAKIIVLSVLPVSQEREAEKCKNEIIIDFNVKLQEIATNNDCVFVDLNSLYRDENGKLNNNMTKDGIHLYPEAYDKWAEKIRPYIEE